MVKLGPPLGWNASFIDETEKPENYCKKLSILIYDENQVRFIDVLEELYMIAIIKEEINKFL